MCIRPDLAGVTSFVRALGLSNASYHCLLNFFHFSALNIHTLAVVWLKTILNLLARHIVRIGLRPIVIVDGIKRPKEGKKMPAVKSLHQQSNSNSKRPFIMGHSLQAITILVESAGVFMGIPIAARIHEGLRWTNAHHRSQLEKLAQLILDLQWKEPVLVVADAYYAAVKFALMLMDNGHHLISRVKSNAVAYMPPPPPPAKKGRGRTKKYGKKSRLADWFKNTQSFKQASSPVYGEKNVTLRYASALLLWRPLGKYVRFVWVEHPNRGRLILLSTDVSLDPLDIIRIYGWRFKIEVSFRQSIHTLGTYAYHFWMSDMTPIRRGDKDQHLHRKTELYRQHVRRKMAAYERYIQIGLIAQGLMQYLAARIPRTVWANFTTYMRNPNTSSIPSEWVVSMALRFTWLQFLRFSSPALPFKNFLASKTSPVFSRFYEDSTNLAA